MGTQDISRSAFDPRKQYAGVRLQQGRVITDDDWNELERIDNEALRRSRVDIIGPVGSPDEGFRISNPRITNEGYTDFDIHPGTLYLGGIRAELFEAETFQLQHDHLQLPNPIPQPRPPGERFDLVVLATYQQPVTAVEDSELFEVALGGPDTTTRLRTMQRILLWPNIGFDTCEAAWQALLARLVERGIGTLNEEHQMITDATLTVSFAVEGASDDLCKPTAAGGYLGAENQAIRVQLIDQSHFTWGFDNASSLYRVQVAANRRTVTMLTEPKDQAHWPLAEQIVEILPWAAVLPNNEKVAETHGHLTRVSASYNPDTSQLTLLNPIPTTDFDDWALRADANDLRAGGEYYYLRVWHRGADRASPPNIPFTPGTPIPLGQTGLEVTFNGTQFQSDDYWIIAARPETPNRVVPWNLESGRRPHGIRRFLAPLALIRWPANQNQSPEVDDCRPRFRPLTEQEICCTYTVGDGKTSHGDFDSLEEAVQRLPSSGGEICLLPGLHQANVVIQNRRNIKITGCDKNTRLIPRLGQRSDPIFRIVDSAGITLAHLDMVNLQGTAVVAAGSEPGSLREITIVYNRILAYQNAIHILHGEQVKVANNIMRMLDKEGGDVALYLLADDARIEGNDIGVVPPEITPPPRDPDSDDEEDNPNPTDPCADPEAFYLNFFYFLAYISFIWIFQLLTFLPKNPYKTLGGIQIGSGSERVKLVDNLISGGAGNGITLGSDISADDFRSPDQPSEPQAAKEILIETRSGAIWGGVSDGTRYLPNVTAVFSGQKETITTVTGGDGHFAEQASEELYNVRLSDPGYQVERVTPIENEEFGTFQEIVVSAVEPEFDLFDGLAFIYDVTIEDNQIANMGLSGIGIPKVNLDELQEALRNTNLKDGSLGLLGIQFITLGLFGAVTGFVVDLIIRRNHIFRCLINVFALEAADLGARTRGVGGISLGLCDNLIIHDNIIEENGLTYRGPAHGIFIIYGDQVDISRNQVRQNGPVEPSELQRGQTGGIALFSVFATSPLQIDEDDPAREARSDPFALRLHDNIVHQPLGRALTVFLGMGPISVANNQLNTDFAAVPPILDQASGGFTNLSGSANVAAIGANPLLLLPLLAATSGTVFIFNLGISAIFQQLLTLRRKKEPGALAAVITELPTGSTLFNDNQVQLGSAQQSVVSQTIFGLDDVSYNSNQTQVLAGEMVLINALVGAITVRANGNRFQEVINLELQSGAIDRFSLLSYGALLNSTSLNQGDYCILAAGGSQGLIDQGNLILIPSADACLERHQASAEAVAGVYAGRYMYQAKG